MFAAGAIWTMTVISKQVSGKDVGSEMAAGITNIVWVNTIMIIILGIIAMIYIGANPAVERTYSLMMTHIALLISIIAASIPALQKIDIATSTRTP